jgi:hypothetical protein
MLQQTVAGEPLHEAERERGAAHAAARQAQRAALHALRVQPGVEIAEQGGIHPPLPLLDVRHMGVTRLVRRAQRVEIAERDRRAAGRRGDLRMLLLQHPVQRNRRAWHGFSSRWSSFGIGPTRIPARVPSW